jgi:hypothetical protein
MSISRREFLQTSGVALTLPFLPSIADAKSRKSTKPSKKWCMMYIPNGINRRGFFPGEEQAILPGFKGGFSSEKDKDKVRVQNKPGYYPLELTTTMQPLKNVKDEVTLITGLERTFKNGQDVHEQGASAYLTSVSPAMATERGMKFPQGRTLDHIIADHVGYKSILPTLEIGTNGFTAPKEPPMFDNISWYGTGKVAPKIRNPLKLYNRLFMSNSFRGHMNEVTSLLLQDSKSLSKRLGKDDKETFGEFMQNIREIEQRIVKLQRIANETNVKAPVDERLPRGQYMRLMTDLMILSFQMGITNICTYMIGPERWEAPLLYEGVFDRAVNHHTMTHNQKGEGYKGVIKIDIFHMQQYAYMIERMKSIKESDGTSMLHNSILTYGAAIGDGATHQFFDLPMIVAGGAQGGIQKQGRFIKAKSGTLNSNLWLTVAQLMGANINTYSDCTGPFSQLTS